MSATKPWFSAVVFAVVALFSGPCRGGKGVPGVNEGWACFQTWEDLPGMWATKGLGPSGAICPRCSGLYWTATPKGDGP